MKLKGVLLHDVRAHAELVLVFDEAALVGHVPMGAGAATVADALERMAHELRRRASLDLTLAVDPDPRL